MTQGTGDCGLGIADWGLHTHLKVVKDAKKNKTRDSKFFASLRCKNPKLKGRGLSPSPSSPLLLERRKGGRVLVWMVLLGMGLGMFNPVWGETVLYKVGGTGTSWSSVGTLSGVDAETVPGAIQPVELTPERNVIGMLEWTVPRPKTYESRRYGYVWDNDPDPYGISDRLVMVDGDPTTSTEGRFKELGRSNVGKTFYFDLGVPYFINRCVFYPRQEGADAEGNLYREDFMGGFVLKANDGGPKSFGTTQYGDPLPIFNNVLFRAQRNTQSIVDARFRLQPVRILQLRCTSEDRFEIAEVELYGMGFVAEAMYLSKPINLQGRANLSTLKWWAEGTRRFGEDLRNVSDAQASVEVATRVGEDDTPDIYYNAQGEEISESSYTLLPKAEQGLILPDRAHWGDWSQYNRSGAPIVYKVPPRFLQFRIVLRSNAITDMVRVDSLQFGFHSPVIADSILGEIAVLDNPTPEYGVTRIAGGKRIPLSYDVRAVRPTGRGFDTVEITTPSTAHFKDLQIGRPLTSIQPDTFYTPSNTALIVRLPTRIADDTPVRVIFECAILLFGAPFGGSVSNSEDFPQPVVAGDANATVTTNRLELIMDYQSEGKLLGSVHVQPSVITPNGDGVNDVGVLSYALLQLTREREVRVRIYDVSGRRIRTLWEGRQKNGEYQTPWDGRDHDGELVSPGIYLYRVTVDSDTKFVENVGTVVVVY